MSGTPDRPSHGAARRASGPARSEPGRAASAQRAHATPKRGSRALVAVAVALGIAVVALSIAVLGRGAAPDADARAASRDAFSSGANAAVGASQAQDAARHALPSPTAGPAQTAGSAAPSERSRLAVRVIRAGNGAPVASARVAANDVEVDTDADGRAELLLVPDRVFVTVRAPGPDLLDASGSLEIEAGASRELTIALEGTAEIPFCARLVHAGDGVGLAGVSLRVHHGATTAPVLTAADGALEVLANRTRGFLAVESAGLEPLSIAVVPGHETPERALRVAIAPAAALAATVLDSRDAPVEGVELRLCVFTRELVRPRGHYRGELLWQARATTDRDGRARFDRLPTGTPLSLSIVCLGRRLPAADPHVVLEPGDNERTWRVARPGSVTGRVVRDDGAPLAGVLVDAVPVRDVAAPTPASLPERSPGEVRGAVRTGDDGRFALAGLPSGAWLVGIAAEPDAPADGPRYRMAPACVRVEVLPDTVAECTITTGDGLSIAGRALRADGTPAVGQLATARRTSDGFSSRGRIDADGAFACAPLLPGDYDVSVDAAFEAEWATLAPLRVRAGRADVELRLLPACGSLSGRVVVADGGVPARVWVTARAVVGGGTLAFHGDIDGAFRFVGLRQGLWTVQARDLRGRAAVATALRIEAGQAHTGVVLPLTDGAELVLQHPPAGGALAFEVCRDDVVVYDDPLAEPGLPGLARCIVAPGRWEVRFLVDGVVRHRSTVDVAAGEERVVVGG